MLALRGLVATTSYLRLAASDMHLEKLVIGIVPFADTN